MSDTKQKLKEMAQLTVFANRISEVQEKNLKMFPFVFFMNVKEVSINYDLGHGVSEDLKEVHHKSFVSYDLTLDDSIVDINLERRFLALESSVRHLFWNDIRVQIMFNGKRVYESKV